MARRDTGGRSATLGLSTMLPGLILVLVIFWALAAVLMLTGTLINAREIDETVDVINEQVAASDGIDEDLDNVKLAAETNRIAAKIRRRAAPLTGQANQVITAAKSIDGKVDSILSTAGSINDTATSINSTVTSINSNVNSINSTVVSIHGLVEGIGADVFAINGLADSIFAKVGAADASSGSSIRASVGRILSDLTGVNTEVGQIDRGVAAINRRGDRAIAGARGIKGDFEGILTQVGLGSAAGHQSGGAGKAGIHGHANSIDCAALINVVGATQYCNR